MAYDTIEAKLRALAECGFKLRDQFTVSDLVESWGREALDKPGFELSLVCLGMTQEVPPWSARCETLWHFDTECIEGDGSYVHIAKRMAEMAQGSLPFSDFEDHVDVSEETLGCGSSAGARRCTLTGNKGDWVDSSIFGTFVLLLARHDPNKVFICYDLAGQDCIIGCATRDHFEMLRRLIPSVRRLSSTVPWSTAESGHFRSIFVFVSLGSDRLCFWGQPGSGISARTIDLHGDRSLCVRGL